MNYRLYAFVANHYLSPLQAGLQTAHVVGELMTAYKPDLDQVGDSVYDWAQQDKTIIICGAGNHQGVEDCWAELVRTGIETHLVAGAIFHEDERSMNGMATACGVIVPETYWDTTFIAASDSHPYDHWEHRRPGEKEGTFIYRRYRLTHPEGQLINHIKSFRLA
jgi:hypothetical protein